MNAAARVVVGPREALETTKVILRDVNWLGDTPLEAIGEDGVACFAKLRSTRPPKPARIRVIDGVAEVELEEGESGIAAGQACVLYSSPDDEARVYGGGFIERSERSPQAEALLSQLLSAAPSPVPAA